MGHSIPENDTTIFRWINPNKSASDVQRERHRMVTMVVIRYGLVHYLDDIWQEWQLAVLQKTEAATPIPIPEREFITFGIARNLCRSQRRKEQRMVPIVGSGGAQEELEYGIQEKHLARRRIDEGSGPINRLPDTPVGQDSREIELLTTCIRNLRPSMQTVIRETYVEGRASHEVGAELGLTAENVRQQLRRAREELRRCVLAKLTKKPGKGRKDAKF